MTAPEIAGFTYLQHIGSGGFADVYLYEQQYPQQRVAVKVVRADVPMPEREAQLVMAEANAMARLGDHPYIVSVLTAGVTSPEQGGRPYLVMRYCPPPDLGVRVRHAPMSVADAVATGIKLASAVETAHRAGIVHRDIKPSNVLVTSYQEPALTDFGIAGHLHELGGEQEVRISYPWSPPELLDARSNGSVASDVYSLGATLWNLLTGRSPFSVPHGDNSSRALSARILHSPAPPTGRPDVPASLEALLAQCLAKQPDHRPLTALDLARSLQRIEAAAGFSRTPIAVEGDRPPVGPGSAPPPAPGSGGHDPDVTYVKPITVIPASGPRAARIEADRSGAPATPAAADSSGRAGLVWALVGALVLVAAVVAVVLVSRGGSDDTVDPTPTTAPTTPQNLEPDAPEVAPSLAGARHGAKVTFTWSYPDRGRAGDSWEYRLPDAGTDKRTSATSLTLRSAGRTCLQVRLIRGSLASPYADRCVS